MNTHQRAECAVIPRRYVLDLRSDRKTTPLVRDDVPQPPMGMTLPGQFCEVRVAVHITSDQPTTRCRVLIYDWARKRWIPMRGDLIGPSHSVWRAGIDAGNVGPEGLTRMRLDVDPVIGAPSVRAWINLSLVPPERFPDPFGSPSRSGA